MSNVFAQYAQEYNVSIADAIADRDDPADARTLRKWFVEAAGREPTEEEMRTMGPNTQEQIDEQIAWYGE